MIKNPYFHVTALKLLYRYIKIVTEPLCVNIDVASNKEVNYGIFKSSDGRRVKKSLAA